MQISDFNKIVDFIRDLYKVPHGNILLHAPVFNGNEKKYITECIDSTFVSSVGKFVEQFEAEIAMFTKAGFAVACVNGTSALQLALKVAGVEPGDEVITQPLTFIATANAITYCGAHPVFLDVDMETLGLSPENLRSWLDQNVVLKKGSGETQFLYPFDRSTGKRISACLPMHTFGLPCKIDEIVSICEEFYIPVVEDSAESLGSFFKGKHTGTFGTIGVLSFNGNKIITTGGGGMLLFHDEELAVRAKHLSTQAKVPHQWEFFHDEIGYNFRLPNINAALGLAQLEQIETFLGFKREIAERYKSFFSDISSNILFKEEPSNSKSNYWLNSILLANIDQRDRFLKYTNEKGVMTRPTWKLMNELPMYSDCQRDDLSNSYYISQRLVNIPSGVIH